MAMAAGGRRGQVQSEINVTPLIDVCLVLLIIFMVVTPMLQRGMPVQLPTTTEPEKKPDSAKQVIISVTNDGKVYVNQDWVSDESFLERMKDYFEMPDTKELVLKGDKRLEYGAVLKVLRILNEAGFSGVGLITEKEKKES